MSMIGVDKVPGHRARHADARREIYTVRVRGQRGGRTVAVCIECIYPYPYIYIYICKVHVATQHACSQYHLYTMDEGANRVVDSLLFLCLGLYDCPHNEHTFATVILGTMPN